MDKKCRARPTSLKTRLETCSLIFLSALTILISSGGPIGKEINITFLNPSNPQNSKILAAGIQDISVLVGSVFNLILADANSSENFLVAFTLNTNAVTTAKILDGAVTGLKLGIPACTGQFLKYNGTTWVVASVVDGQIYTGYGMFLLIRFLLQKVALLKCIKMLK